MGFNRLQHDLENLASDDDPKIATLAQAILQIMEEEAQPYTAMGFFLPGFVIQRSSTYTEPKKPQN